MADEPVTAYRDPWLARAARWARRHRTHVATAASLLVASVVGLSIGSVLLKQANNRTERQRQVASSHFQQARDAVDTLLTDLGDTELADVPQMEQLRGKMLSQAREFNAEFLALRGDDPATRYELALAYLREGIILEMLGKYEQSETALKQSIEGLEALLEQPSRPESTTAARWPGPSTTRGILLRKSDRLTEAEPAFQTGHSSCARGWWPSFQTWLADRVERDETIYHRAAMLRPLARPGSGGGTGLPDSASRISRRAADQPDFETQRAHYLITGASTWPVIALPPIRTPPGDNSPKRAKPSIGSTATHPASPPTAGTWPA